MITGYLLKESRKLIQLTDKENFLINMMLTVVLGLIACALEWVIYHRLLLRYKKKQHIWRETFLLALHKPFHVFLWSIVILAVLFQVAKLFSFDPPLLKTLDTTRLMVVIAVVFWFCMRFIRKLENKLDMLAKEGAVKIHDPTSIHAGSQFSRVVIVIIILLTILQTLGVKLSALLAFGGVGALVLGFAAKDSLANFVGGMMLYWDRPFSLGDWICSPDRNIEGTVENIGWRLTRIRTFNKRVLYVPNGVLSTIVVVNPSKMTNRRIKITIGVRYDDANKISDLSSSIEKMLYNHSEIDTSQTLFVCLTEFEVSSLNLLVYAFTKTTQWVKFQNIQQEIFLKIIDIITQHGAECAFPTRTIAIPDGLILKEKE